MNKIDSKVIEFQDSDIKKIVLQFETGNAEERTRLGRLHTTGGNIKSSFFYLQQERGRSVPK